jgi:hypothetical protein
MLNNTEYILPFIPEKDDGDTFIYTELLDRTAKKGNNNYRLLRTFYHRSQEEFLKQMPTIIDLCEMTKIRAYTRLAPRSYKKVGKLFAQLVVEAAMADNWTHMKALYGSACGRVTPTTKYWLFDVDKITDRTDDFADRLGQILIARIPSRKGEHLITKPFDVRLVGIANWDTWGEISLHKDNPTNLYIPEGAA